MQVILSPFVLGSTTAAAGLAGSQHWLAGVAFVMIAGLVIGATSAAQEARRARQRSRALQHRLPFDSRLV
jgi:hypothetical protein